MTPRPDQRRSPQILELPTGNTAEGAYSSADPPAGARGSSTGPGWGGPPGAARAAGPRRRSGARRGPGGAARPAVGPLAGVIRPIDREPRALELVLEPEGHGHAGGVARLVGE